MVKFDSAFDIYNFINSELNSELDLALVVSKDDLEIILDSVEFNTKSFTKELDSEKYLYLIDKYTDMDENIYLDVRPIEFDENSEMITDVCSQYVVVLEGLLEECDLEFIDADTVDIIGFEEEDYEDEEDEEDYDLSEECLGDCQSCNGCEEEIDEFDNYLENMIQEFEDVLNEKSDDMDFCFHCELKQLIASSFLNGYDNGKESVTEELENLLDRLTE